MKRKLGRLFYIVLVVCINVVILAPLVANAVSISLSTMTFKKTNITMYLGQSETMEIIFRDPDATDKSVTYTSSFPDVATVESNGNVTAVAAGVTQIKAESQQMNFIGNQNIQTICTVTVIEKSTSALLETPTVTATANGSSTSVKVSLKNNSADVANWKAYSNDKWITLTDEKKSEIYNQGLVPGAMKELTIYCDPTNMRVGNYSGTITFVSGEKKETLLVYLYNLKDVEVPDLLSEIDPFKENRRFENFALSPTAGGTGKITVDSVQPTFIGSSSGLFCNGDNLNDGSISMDVNGNYWLSSYRAGLWGQHWLICDLGEEKEVSKIYVYGFETEAAKWTYLSDYTVYGSNDSTEWTELINIKGSTQLVTTHNIAPVKYRYFKMNIWVPVQPERTSSRDVDIVRMMEFKVLGEVEVSENEMVKELALIDPTKKSYSIGDELDLTGGKINVTYSDNTSAEKNLTDENVIVTGYDKTKAGEQTVTVNYGGKSKTFTVNVSRVLDSIVLTEPTKKVYNIGDKLDLTGGKISVIYKDGYSQDKLLTDEGVSVSGYDKTKAGEQTVTVSYAGLSKTFAVSVAQSNKVTINGKLIDKEGKPIVNTKIELHSNIISTTTDANGNFVFSNVEIGEHTLYVKDANNNNILAQTNITVISGENTSVNGANITVRNGVTTVSFVVKLIANSLDILSITENNPKTADYFSYLLILIALSFAAFLALIRYNKNKC